VSTKQVLNRINGRLVYLFFHICLPVPFPAGGLGIKHGLHLFTALPVPDGLHYRTDCSHIFQFLPNHAIMQNGEDAAKFDVEKGALSAAAPIAASEPHSIYTKNQKRMMVVAAAIASTFSPLTGNIYLPALNSVAHDLKVSNSVILLTVSFYMVSIKISIRQVLSITLAKATSLNLRSEGWH